MASFVASQVSTLAIAGGPVHCSLQRKVSFKKQLSFKRQPSFKRNHSFKRNPSFKRNQSFKRSFASVGNGIAQPAGSSSRLQFLKRLTPLQIKKADRAFTLSVNAAAASSSPTPGSASAVYTSTKEAETPVHVVDDDYHKQVVKELGRMYNIQSPDRRHYDKTHPYSDLQVRDRWREIQGADNWEGLVDDKMDPVLRGEVIRYGEFAQATYDAFDCDHFSKFCGSAKYNKKKLLKEVGLENRGYEIMDYIYATADTHLPKIFKRPKGHKDTWSKDSNFMGFVAVCTCPREIARLGRRDVVVAWRGTVTKLEWLENVRDFLTPTGLDPRNSSDVMVESGFLSVYKSSNENSRYNKLSARQQVLKAVKKLVKKYKHEEMSITVTGHSLGSALSMICAYDIAESGINKRAHTPRVSDHWDGGRPEDSDHHHENPCDRPVPVSVFSFAGPRVGNSAFKRRIEELGVKVLRVVNKHDQVPRVPGVIFNESLEFLHQLASWLPHAYHHVGIELELDSLKSEYLKPTTDPLHAHNMEAYLHLLDCYHGPDGDFCSALGRDVALVNKASDFLRPELGIPPCWWQEQHKGLVKDDAGRWTVRPRDAEDLPENHHYDNHQLSFAV